MDGMKMNIAVLFALGLFLFGCVNPQPPEQNITCSQPCGEWGRCVSYTADTALGEQTRTCYKSMGTWCASYADNRSCTDGAYVLDMSCSADNDCPDQYLCNASKCEPVGCVGEGQSIPLVGPSAMAHMPQECCEGLALTSPPNGMTGSRGTCARR